MPTTWPLTAREYKLLEAVRESLPECAISAAPSAADDRTDVDPQLRFAINGLDSIALRREAIARMPSLSSLTRLVVLELSQDLQRQRGRA